MPINTNFCGVDSTLVWFSCSEIFFWLYRCPVGCSLVCQNIMKLWPKLIQCQLQLISTVFWICTIGFPPLNLTFYSTGAQPGVLSHAKVSSDSDITRSNANQYHNGTYLYLLLLLIILYIWAPHHWYGGCYAATVPGTRVPWVTGYPFRVPGYPVNLNVFKASHRQTNKQTNTQTDRQTNRQTDKQTQ